MTRSEAREAAFALLFENNFKDDSAEEIMALAAEYREMKISGFGKGLFMGTMEHIAEIDEKLESAMIKWSSKRVSKVALTALRLCFYELAYTDIQTEIAINEMLELIKKFDSPESASFANGVLGTVVTELGRNS